jgi:hypothetical protein
MENDHMLIATLNPMPFSLSTIHLSGISGFIQKST